MGPGEKGVEFTSEGERGARGCMQQRPNKGLWLQGRAREHKGFGGKAE